MSTKASKPLTQGWWNPTPFRANPRFHYDDGLGMSLCRRWARVAQEIDSNDKHDHPDNCAACKKKREQRYANK